DPHPGRPRTPPGHDRPVPPRAAPGVCLRPVAAGRQRPGIGLLAGGAGRPADGVPDPAAYCPGGPHPARAPGGLRRLRRAGALSAVPGCVVTSGASLMARAGDIVTELYTVVWNEGDLGAVERLVAAAHTIHPDPGDPWEG